MAAQESNIVALCQAAVSDMSSPALHLQIYDVVQHNADRHPNPTKTPPLPVVLYSIRNILEPSFILDQIPELLHLIVHLEIFRNNTLEKSLRVLRRDKTLRRKNKPSLRLLSHEERAALESHTENSCADAMRTIYRKVIHGCCLLHIYHVCLTYDPRTSPNSHPPLDYLIDYFPAFARRDDNAADASADALSDFPWNYNLSQQELRDNTEQGERAAEFLVKASQYFHDPNHYCLENGFQLGESFESIFKPPRQEETVRAINIYTELVRQAAVALKPVLDDSDRSILSP